MATKKTPAAPSKPAAEAKAGGASGKPKASEPVIERFTNIEANQILTIKEGSGIIKAEKIKV